MTREERVDAKVVPADSTAAEASERSPVSTPTSPRTPATSLSKTRRLRRVEAALKRVELQHLRSQAPARAKDWTLDTFPADDVAGRRALKAARHWIEDGGIMQHPRLFIHGPPGTGKTGLAYSIARKWVSYGGHRGAEFENVRALLERQKAPVRRRQRDGARPPPRRRRRHPGRSR